MSIQANKPKVISIITKKPFLSVSNNYSYLNYSQNSLQVINDKSNILLIKDNKSSSRNHLITAYSGKLKSSNRMSTPLSQKHPFCEDNIETYNKIVSLIKTSLPYFEHKMFIISPLPHYYSLICNIHIEYNSCLELMYPKIILSLNNNERVILIAKKQFSLSGVVFNLYLDNEGNHCIGILESNFKRSNFKLFTVSINKLNSKMKKKLICSIAFNKALLDFNNNPMEIEVTFPNRINKYFIPYWSSTKENSQPARNKASDAFLIIRNKKPKWLLGI